MKKKKRRQIESDLVTKQHLKRRHRAHDEGSNDTKVRADTIELKGNEVIVFEGIGKVKVKEGLVSVNGFEVAVGDAAIVVTGNSFAGWPLFIHPKLPKQGEYNGPALPGQIQVEIEEIFEDRRSGITYDTELKGAGEQDESGVEVKHIKSFTYEVNESFSTSQHSKWDELARNISVDVIDNFQSYFNISELSTLVCGPKNSGKSTFCRLLVNKLLNESPFVVFLEADCGQPEFTPPGVVSLIAIESPITGPPFMHMRKPLKSCFIGHTTAKDDPVLYFNSILHLVEWYSENGLEALRASFEDKAAGLQHMVPLVLNTPGWVKGLGFEILNRLVTQFQPKHIVRIHTNTAKDVPVAQHWGEDHGQVVHDIQAEDSVKKANIAASDMRAMMWLAFSHQCTMAPFNLALPLSQLFRLGASALCSACPYEVSLKDMKVVFSGDLIVREDLVMHALNTSIIALGRQKDAQHHGCHECIGYGIVRAVNPNTNKIFVLTNVEADSLEEVDTLFVGDVHLPQQLLQNVEYQSPYLCYNAIAVEGTGAGAMKGRNDMRRGRLQ